MDKTQDYKRTIAGSIGAGIGAVLNGSGRTYYILEHKTASKYHQMGESQKIIVDQIELGRHASCQVRFDESCDTVSRRHAAIVRDGNNWKLMNLSQSNPTLVNGQPISGAYYLQSGDEIQLSMGGPRMGFIIPQGRQAMTSSIGFTERMSLFRQQALRPYKQALIAICVLFVLAMAGMSYWLVKQSNDLQQAKQEYIANMAQIDSLRNQSEILNAQLADLDQQLANATDPAQRQQIRDRIVYIKQQVAENTRRTTDIQSANAGLSQKYGADLNDDDDDDDYDDEVEPVMPAQTNTQPATSNTYTNNNVDDSKPNSAAASNDLQDYYKYIYTLKVDRIEIEYGGVKFDPGIATSDIVVGTGFLLSNGSFVTDRQNVQPWIYSTDQPKDYWRWRLSEYAAVGCKVILHYSAYSHRGTGQPLHFTNLEFGMDELSDVNYVDVKISKEVRAIISKNRIEIKSSVYKTARRSVWVPSSRSYAIIRGKATGGIPFDTAASGSLPASSDVRMAGYVGETSRQNPVIQTFDDKTTTDGTSNSGGTIALQNSQGRYGYYGSPAFIQKNGKFYLVGMMVGAVNGYDRLVPARNFCR